VPGTLAETAGFGLLNPDHARELGERLAEAILAAERSAEPVSIRHLAGSVSGDVIRNRTEDGGPVFRRLDLLRFERRPTSAPTSTPPSSSDRGMSQAGPESALVTMAFFAAHPTCRPTKDLRPSADYPGAFRAAFEADGRGPLMFVAGAVGSMARGEDPAAGREAQAAVLGRKLADEAGRLLSAPVADRDRSLPPLDRRTIRVALPAPRVRFGFGCCLSPVTASVLIRQKVRVETLRLGPVLLLGSPADHSGALALELFASPASATVGSGSGSGPVPIITSFSGDYVGYLLPERYHDFDRYESRSMSFHGPTAGRIVQRALERELSAARMK
jgi:hypothetical protein